MAIHTIVSQQQIVELLKSYSAGNLITFSGIQAGITNSNYILETDENKLILTLFEELKPNQLPFFINLMRFLANKNIPCPKPIADQNNTFIHIINGKPSILIEFLAGNTSENPTIAQCSEIGQHLANMHLVTPQFTEKQANLRGENWHKLTIEKVISYLSNEDKQLLEHEINFQQQQNYVDLPQGIIHADLFPDNALFLINKLTGIIDFYYACNGYYLWDLAVTTNNWCFNDRTFDQEKIDALINAYQKQRPFNSIENTHWNAIRRSAALRFWLSRLYDYHYPRKAKFVQIKDPTEIKNQIIQLQNNP